MNLTMLATEGKVIPEIGIIVLNNCFCDMRERSCKLRSVGELNRFNKAVNN